MTSATEELRRLLDERGVEWCPSAWDRSTETYWKTADGNGCLATQGETKLRLSFADYLTPEQAVEATLGRGTCHDVGDPSDFCCSECGVRMFTDTNDTYTMIASDGRAIIKHPNYCPNCGARVVER